MKPLLIFFILLPVIGLSQNLDVSKYDRLDKRRQVELEPVRIFSSEKAALSLAYKALESALYLELNGFGWGAFAIDEGQEVIFRFSNDSTVTVKSTEVQIAEVNAAFQNAYRHNYFIKEPDIRLMSEYEVVGIRKYGLGDPVDMKVSRDNALKIKRLSAQFLQKLKNAGGNLQDININDISKHIGDSVRFCAKVYNTRYFESAVNKPTILDLSDSYTSQLSVIIWEQDRKNFSNAPESLYHKKDVCVTGVVETNNNLPQIVVRNRDQITVKTPIDLSEAARFVGDSVTVTGKVRSGKGASASSTLLNMGTPNGELLTVVIENKDRGNFNSAPETYYLNKEITVRGRIEMYQGKPGIVVLTKDQISELPQDVGKVITQPGNDQPGNKKDPAPVQPATSVAKNPGVKSASFPGGQEALLKFLRDNLVIPMDELNMGEKKVVVANFLINADGKASNIRITRPGGKGFDQEVIRVIKLMPKWEPHMSNGSPVPVSVTQPVTFVRQKSDSN